MPPTINPTDVTKHQRPIVTSIKIDANWSFSFRYFNQIPFFALDRSEPKWFVSLLVRLKELSQKSREDVFSDIMLKRFYKYHTIDWNSKNIPIKKEDLTWVDKVYLENDEEYPFHQFKISKAFGRVVGFWNEDSKIFYIVLLDPLHNMQPSKSYNYAVNDCYPLSCEYSSMHNDIHELMTHKSSCEECNIKIKLSSIPTKLNQSTAIVGYLDEDFLKEFEKISEKKSLSEILQLGILAALEK